MLRVVIVVLVALLMALPAAAQRSTIFELPDDIDTIAPGDTVEADLTEDAPLRVYAFEAEEGDAFSFLVEDSQFQTSYIAVVDDEGMVLSASSRDPLSEGSARLVLFIAPDEGTYYVLVTTGGYSITQRHSVDASFVLTAETVEYEELKLGDEVEIVLDEETPLALYALPLVIGDIPQIILQTRNAQLSVGSVYDENFNPRSGNNPVGSTDLYVSPFYMLDDDTLYILVSTPFMRSEAEATLLVQAYEAVQVTDGETVTVSIAPETVTNFVQFEAENGQNLTLSVEAADSIDAQIAVFDPSGRVIAVESGADGVRNLRLRESGLYTVQVFPGGFIIDLSSLGEVSVTLGLR